MLEEDARSLKETLPAAILDDYRLLLASPIAPYYMDMLVNFKTPGKIQLFSLARISRVAAKYLLLLSSLCSARKNRPLP